MNKDDIQPPGHKADFAIAKVIRSKRMIVVDAHIDHAPSFGVLGPLTLHGDNVSGPVRFGEDGQYVRILIDVAATMDFDEALAYVQAKQNASVAQVKDLGEHFDIWREEEEPEEKEPHPLDELWKQLQGGKPIWSMHYPCKPGDTIPGTGVFGFPLIAKDDEDEDEDGPEE